MPRDLWKELARRARAEREPAAIPPFGFESEILAAARCKTASAPNEWSALLRPALALSFALMLLCLLIQYRASTSVVEPDLVTQTDAMLRTALYNE